MTLNWLTNPDPNLQEKMRYFSDNFIFTNEYLGRIPGIPYDNPLSLVGKIIFQIENNIEHAPRYMENHYRQLVKYYEPFLLHHVPEFNAVKNEFIQYNLCPAKEKPRIAWLKQNPQLLTNLKTVAQILEEKLFQIVFVLISKYLQCSHSLKKHKRDLEFCTQILVSLFRLSGHTQKQVAGYIHRILSSDRFDFPFPLEVYEQHKAETFKSVTEQFLENRDFKKQFDGLQNLMINRQKRKGNFFFAIDHVALDKEVTKTFRHTIDKVTFMSPAHTALKLLRRSMREVDKTARFKMYPLFFSKQKLICFVNIPFENRDDAAPEALKIIKEEVALFNFYLDVKMEVNEKNFFFAESLDTDLWSGKCSLMKYKISHVSGIKFDWLKENPFDLLKDKVFKDKEHLLHNEIVFARAMQQHNTPLFWQYVENLYWFQNSPKIEVREKFANVAVQSLQRFHDSFLLNIGHLFWGMDRNQHSKEIADSDEIIATITSELGYNNNVKFPLLKYRASIKHTFLKSVIALYGKTKSKNFVEEWREHFASIILELQEYRNATLHSGYANPHTVIKMNDIIPEIVSKARWRIIDACLDNKGKSFPEILNELSR